MGGDGGHQCLDEAERPSTLQEAIDRAQCTEQGEDQDELAAATFQRVSHQHVGDSE